MTVQDTLQKLDTQEAAELMAESITIRSTGMTRKAAWQYVLCMERPYRRNQHQHRAANRTS